MFILAFQNKAIYLHKQVGMGGQEFSTGFLLHKPFLSGHFSLLLILVSSVILKEMALMEKGSNSQNGFK